VIRLSGKPPHRWCVLIVGVLLLAVAGGGCASDYESSGTNEANAALENVAREATLRVRSIGCTAAGLGTGSAFVIDGNTLVTNRHVAEGTREIQLSTWDGRDFKVSVGSISHINDLAVLRIQETVKETFTRGPSAEEGQTVHAVGYPLGDAWTLTSGEIYDIVDGDEYGETGKVIRMTAGVQPGNSGGPLLDDEGRVVGIVFAMDTRNGLALAISAERLDDLPQATTRVGTRESC